MLRRAADAEVQVPDDLFIGVKLDSYQTVLLYSCWATPGESNSSGYDIITSGCAADSQM